MFQKIKRIVGFTILTAFLFTFGYFTYIKVTDTVPTLFGYRLLRVYSDSMEPELAVGEIIIIKNVDPEVLEYGDVISYHAQKGYLKGNIVTHQISKEPYEKDGIYYFTTRGIRPEAVDDPEISEEQIIGEVIFKIPILGTVYDFFTRWYGLILLAVLLIAIFADDVITLFMKLRDRNKAEDDAEHTNINDLAQSERVMNQRLNEFEGIITDLDDPDL